MTLPSQSSRGGFSGRLMMSRKRRKIPLPLLLFLLVAAGALGWVAFSTLTGPEQAKGAIAEADPEAAQEPPRRHDNEKAHAATSEPEVIEPLPEPVKTEPEPEIVRAPVEFEQGKKADARPTLVLNSAPDPGTEIAAEAPRETKTDPAPRTSRGSDISRAISDADRLLNENNAVEARRVLNEALAGASGDDARLLRERLMAINDDLFFSPRVVKTDPLSEAYEIASGDSLAKIAKSRDLAIDWRLLQRVNRIGDPRRIRVGQRIKLVRGPFHAIVDKSDYRIDLYAGPPDYPEEWMYVRSFRVGLGEDNGTPLGEFVVKKDSKLVNPHWRNPRTGERFDADDPLNPIGEHWLGLTGLGDAAMFEGYGLHGTIEPGSIGRDESMGCVRMVADDIAVVYEMLVEGLSRVSIVP